jgi:hypothetical protein
MTTRSPPAAFETSEIGDARFRISATRVVASSMTCSKAKLILYRATG